VNLTDEHIPMVVRALEHYAAYLRATNRDERFFVELAESLKRKEQAKEEPARSVKKKRA
jgi:hypothetical protein